MNKLWLAAQAWWATPSDAEVAAQKNAHPVRHASVHVMCRMPHDHYQLNTWSLRDATGSLIAALSAGVSLPLRDLLFARRPPAPGETRGARYFDMGRIHYSDVVHAEMMVVYADASRGYDYYVLAYDSNGKDPVVVPPYAAPAPTAPASDDSDSDEFPDVPIESSAAASASMAITEACYSPSGTDCTKWVQLIAGPRGNFFTDVRSDPLVVPMLFGDARRRRDTHIRITRSDGSERLIKLDAVYEILQSA